MMLRMDFAKEKGQERPLEFRTDNVKVIRSFFSSNLADLSFSHLASTVPI